MFKEGDKVYYRDDDGINKFYIGEIIGERSSRTSMMLVEWRSIKNNSVEGFTNSYSTDNLVLASVIKDDNPNFTFAMKKDV